MLFAVLQGIPFCVLSGGTLRSYFIYILITFKLYTTTHSNIILIFNYTFLIIYLHLPHSITIDLVVSHVSLY